MSILFDHQTFSLQNFGGISRYYTELIQGINQKPGYKAYLGILLSNNIHLKEAGLGVKQFIPNHNFHKKLQLLYRANQFYSTVCLNTRSYDVFHATYYDPYFLTYLKGRPFVITFLDMIQEKFNERFPDLDDGGTTIARKRLLAHKAERIITISESTKRDIVEILDVDPAKIVVTYLGNSLKIVSPKLTDEVNPEPYLLYVGRRERYKNFNGLLQAIHPLLEKFRVKLICAGGDSFTAEEHSLIHSLKADAWVEQRAINDRDLQTLYQQAVAFIFPSLYEGFGIPILEAFACGCPCIVSNTSSLPEVAGDAALYMDPNSIDSMAYAVEQILSDLDLRTLLIQRGYKQLAQFSWQRTVDETIAVYQSIT